MKENIYIGNTSCLTTLDWCQSASCHGILYDKIYKKSVVAYVNKDKIVFIDRNVNKDTIYSGSCSQASIMLYDRIIMRDLCVCDLFDATILVNNASWRTGRCFSSAFLSRHAVELPRPEKVIAELTNLLNPINSDISSRGRVESAICAFFDFLRIHPFIGGNGRVARILLSCIVSRELGADQPWALIDSYLNGRRVHFLRAAFRWHLHADPSWMLCFVRSALSHSAAIAGRELTQEMRDALHVNP